MRKKRRKPGTGSRGDPGAPRGGEPPPAGDGLEAVAAAVRASRRPVITSHVNGDGDAIGSALGLARGLEALGAEPEVVLADLPSRYRFLDSAGAVRVIERPSAAGDLEGRDLGIVLDTTDPERTGTVQAALFDGRRPLACIDHHLADPRPEYRYRLLRPDAAATGSLVLELLDHLGVALDAHIGEPLFVAIATDTGWFRYSNTSASALRDAARLREAGVDPEPLFTRIYESLDLGRVRLQGVVLDRMRADLDGAFIWADLDHETIARSGVPRTDFEGLIDPLRSVRGVEVVAFLTEPSPGSWKVSFRSRGACNVRTIAGRLGGGGHARAAGCTIEGAFAQVIERVRDEVRGELARARDRGAEND